MESRTLTGMMVIIGTLLIGGCTSGSSAHKPASLSSDTKIVAANPAQTSWMDLSDFFADDLESDGGGGTGGASDSGGSGGSDDSVDFSVLCAGEWQSVPVPNPAREFTRGAKSFLISPYLLETSEQKPWEVFLIGADGVTQLFDEHLPPAKEYTTATTLGEHAVILGQAFDGSPIAARETVGGWIDLALPPDLPEDAKLIDIAGESVDDYALLVYSPEKETALVFRSAPKWSGSTVGSGFFPTSITCEGGICYVVGNDIDNMNQPQHGRLFASQANGWNEVALPPAVHSLNRVKSDNGKVLALGGTSQGHGLIVDQNGNMTIYEGVAYLQTATFRSPYTFIGGNGSVNFDFYSRLTSLNQAILTDDLPYLMASRDMWQWDGKVYIAGEEGDQAVLIACDIPSP